MRNSGIEVTCHLCTTKYHLLQEPIYHIWYTVMEVAACGIFAFIARHLLAAAVRRMVRWDVFETKLRRNWCTSMGCGVAHAQMNQRSRRQDLTWVDVVLAEVQFLEFCFEWLPQSRHDLPPPR